MLLSHFVTSGGLEMRRMRRALEDGLTGGTMRTNNSDVTVVVPNPLRNESLEGVLPIDLKPERQRFVVEVSRTRALPHAIVLPPTWQWKRELYRCHRLSMFQYLPDKKFYVFS